MVPLHVRIHEQEHSKLKRLAEIEDRSIAAVVRRLISSAPERPKMEFVEVPHDNDLCVMVVIIGRLFEKEVSLNEADWIIWNRTGFPSFWHREPDWRIQFLTQICNHFISPKSDDEVFQEHFELNKQEFNAEADKI